MFRRDSDGVLRAETLAQLPWLQHGFGTKLSSGWPDQSRLATAKQVHSNHVLRVETTGPQGEGDALITWRPAVGVAIRTADCLPILMADPRHRAVAAVHAGWRGVVSEVVSKTVEAMTRHFDTNPQDLVVAIGPAIGPCCFEVGPEVAEKFGLSGRVKVDLIETTCRQLGRYGVNPRQISSSGLCSYCHPELLESYRRDREAAGRMMALIEVIG